jgi:general secretion pathway protein D
LSACGGIENKIMWIPKQMNYKTSDTIGKLHRTSTVWFLHTASLLLIFFAGCSLKPKDATTSSQQNRLSDSTSLAKDARSYNKEVANPDSPAKSLSPVPSEQPDNTSPAMINTELTEGTKPALSNEEISPVRVLLKKQESAGTEFRPPQIADSNMANELISVNFDQMDIRTVIKTVGDITGINFVVDDGVQGTVTVMSPTKIRLADLYEFLQSILEVKGYASVPSGNLVKIVPRAEAAKRNLLVRTGGNSSQIPQSDSIVTQIIPLTFADATEVSQIIKPLLSNGSQMSTYTKTNTILITDTSSNISHVARVIEQLDHLRSEEKVAIINLTHASPEVVSEQIVQIMDRGKSAGRGQNNSSVESQLRILTDKRTNSLIVVANPQDIETVKSFAKQLDVEKPRGTNNVHVKYLKNATAKEVAQSLTAALANLKIAGALDNAGSQQISVASDEGTNSLIITASAQDYDVITEIIDKLDIVRESVLVEMLIVEVSQDSLKEIGVDWATLDQAVGSVRYFGGTNFGVREDYANGDLEGLVVGAWKKNGSETSIGPIMHALDKISGVNILSTPHILTSNHHKARIIVGENMPFVTQSRITETDPETPTVIKTFEYKDVGIMLEITPHISQGGLVRLEINSQFTKLIESLSTTASETPTTAKREAQTVVSMNNGSTVVIGGLIRDDKTSIQKKIPLVSDIPLLGQLFQWKRDRIQKTNMLIFITPHIVSNQQDLNNLTAEKKQQMDSSVKDINTEKTNKDNK